MKCPHCLVEINPDFEDKALKSDRDGNWFVYYMICPNPSCKRIIVKLNKYGSKFEEFLVYPLASSRPPVPPEVDKHIAQDYTEACLVLTYSPKASAALSRRCLQNILREKAGVKKEIYSKKFKKLLMAGSCLAILLKA